MRGSAPTSGAIMSAMRVAGEPHASGSGGRHHVHISHARVVAALVFAGLCRTRLLAANTIAAPVYYEVVHGGHPHDVAASPAAGGPVYYTAQMTGKLGILDPAQRQGRGDRARRRVRAARRDRRTRRQRVGHRWRPECDRARRCRDACDAQVASARRHAECESEYAHVRRQGRLWFTGQSGYYGRLDPAAATSRYGKRRAARALRHHHDAVRRGVLRVARRQSHCAHRHRQRERQP